MTFFGCFIAAFIVTGMLNQMFPDGRFPTVTIVLVIILATGGAYTGHLYLGDSSIFTGAFIGAGITSSLFFSLFHRTGVLAQEPWPTPPEESPNPHDI